MDVDKVFSSLAQSGLLGGLAGGAVSGALMSNKKVRKNTGTLLKAGGIAALGAMAWKAYQGYQTRQVNQPAGGAAQTLDPAWQGLEERAFDLQQPPPTPAVQTPQVLLIKAMIAAACADGHLDAEERERVMGRIGQLSLAPDEKVLIFDALQSPPTMASICQQVNSPELAAEVYLSSLMAVDRDRPQARLYLETLAFRLGLPQGLAEQMWQDLDARLPSAAA